ncbi:hypothetical protein D3C86_1353370 [compost metagenome]
MHAARHQVVAGPFRGALGEDRGLDLDEAVVVHVAPDDLVHAVALDHGLLHEGLAQVEEAVLEADGLVDLGLAALDHEGQGPGGVPDDQAVGVDLDLTGGHAGVGHALGAGADLAGHADHVLVAQAVGELVGLGGDLGAEDDLDQTGAIAQVREDDPAVVAAGVDPAVEGHVRADGVGTQVPAVVGTFTEANLGHGGFHFRLLS